MKKTKEKMLAEVGYLKVIWFVHGGAGGGGADGAAAAAAACSEC